MDKPASGRRLRAFVLTLFVSGVAISTAGVVLGVPTDVVSSVEIALPASIIGFVTATLLRFEVRLGAHRLIFLPLDAALILALLLVPVSWVPAAAMLGMALGSVTMRQPGIKLLFNAARSAVAAGAGIAIAAAVGLDFHNRSISGFAGLLLVALIYDLVGNALTAVVVGLAERVRPLTVWWSNIAPQTLTAAGNLTVAALGLVLARVDARLLIVVPLAVLLLHQGYVGRARGREEREAGRRLAEAVRTLTSLDQQEVVRRTAAAAADLLSAQAVEIVLRDRSASLASAYRHGAGTGDEADVTANHLAASEPLDADGESSLGEIRVYFTEEVRLPERERYALRTLAAATHTALQTARAHSRTAELAEQLAYEATHDPLTRLANRQLLEKRVDDHLTTATGDPPAAALALIRLDHFGEVAATLGHAAQDALLRHVAARISDSATLGELVARVDADQFAVFFHEVGDPVRVLARTQQLLTAAEAPLVVDATKVGLLGTAGVAYSEPARPAAAAELLRQASVAAARATRMATDVELYQPAHDTTGPGALLMSAELRSALAENQLTLFYEPILDLSSGGPIAAEASVWWLHPTRGLLPSVEFLPVLESGSLLPAYTDWLLAEALAECGRWAELELAVPVSVNLSARSLLDRELPGRVAAALARSRLAPERLMLELTASSALSSIGTVDVVLEDLLALGVRLAVDDFGTGHSSLTRLLRVPATDLKIAPEFVEGMLTSPQARTIVRAAIEIAQSYDLRATAVGVRTVAHATAIRNLGGHAGQGELYFPPLRPAKVRAALRMAANGAEAIPTADVIPLRSHRGWPNSGL
jgi:diguanylate cyclase (GGDEF)-like protein